MAENNKGILEMLNRAGMSALSIPYNFASDVINTIPGVNTPYIDANADGFMQGGLADLEDLDSTKRARNNIAKATSKYSSGVASLKDDEFYKDKILRDLEQEQKKNKKNSEKKDSNKKETTEEKSKEEEEKDERSMLQKLFEKYDLVSLGNSIGRGEGLLPAIEAQDALIKQEAKDLAAAKVTAAKTEADISYKLALAQQALREKNPEFIRTLTAMGIDPTDPQALELYKEKISKSGGTPDLLELMLLANQGLISQADLKEYSKSLVDSSIGTPSVDPINLTTPD